MVDFVQNFDKVEICNLTSEGIDDDDDDDVNGKLSWHETIAKGAWRKGYINVIPFYYFILSFYNVGKMSNDEGTINILKKNQRKLKIHISIFKYLLNKYHRS